jgi:hypothetical protein
VREGENELREFLFAAKTAEEVWYVGVVTYCISLTFVGLDSNLK